MFRLLFLLLFTTSLYGQSNKYALIIQNRKFTNWDSFLRLEDNSNTIKRLLVEQGFENNNIIIKDNVTATTFRNLFEDFIKKVPIGAICVVFLGSHGHQITDINGDEKENKDFDRKDEVFICTDSPKHNDWVTNMKKCNFDCHPYAIIDDELGDFNDRLLKKIGTKGHYLLLTDFCFSLNSERNDKKSNIIDSSVFTDYLKTQDSRNFVNISASDKEVNVIETTTSYFVSAFEKAFTAFKLSRPTYLELSKEMANYLPTSTAVGNTNQLVFGGEWNGIVKKSFSKIVTIIKENTRGTSIRYVLRINQFEDIKIGTFVELYFNNVLVSEGKVVFTNEVSKEAVIEWINNFEPVANQNYEIRDSKRFQNAFNILKTITNKNEIIKVISLLPITKIDDKIQCCVNESYADETTINQPCQTIRKYAKLDLKDKITLVIDTLGMDKKLYYTYLDINSERVNPCFIDSKGNPLGFISTQEPFIYRSSITKPFGNSSYLVLIADEPIDKDQMSILLGKELNNEQKNGLWNILVHLKGYSLINYQVVASKKNNK